MGKIKKIILNIQKMSHGFYNYLFLDLDKRLMEQVKRKKRIGDIYGDINLYCANNLCVINLNGEIVNVIKKETLIEECFKLDPTIKNEIIKGMRENIEFYNSNDISENILFVLSGKKVLTTEDVFKDEINIQISSYLPELYGDIIKSFISMEKNKKNKKTKILNLIKIIKDKNLAYEIFSMENNYTKSQMLEALINTEGNIDIIKYSMIENTKYIKPLHDFILHIINLDDYVKKITLSYKFLYLTLEDKNKKEYNKSISVLKNLKYNEVLHTFLYDIDY